MRRRPGIHGQIAAGLVVAAVIAGLVGYAQLRAYQADIATNDVRSAAFLTKVAARINGLFPRRIDPETEITRVSAMEGVLIYHYRLVNLAAAKKDMAFLAKIQAVMTKTTCANVVTMDNFLRKDIKLRYSYADQAGLALLSFDVTEADCGV